MIRVGVWGFPCFPFPLEACQDAVGVASDLFLHGRSIAAAVCCLLLQGLLLLLALGGCLLLLTGGTLLLGQLPLRLAQTDGGGDVFDSIF